MGLLNNCFCYLARIFTSRLDIIYLLIEEHVKLKI
jgi:hypothetical protein